MVDEVNLVRILIDTSYFVALSNTRDKYHKRAIELFGDLLSGSWGLRITTDYVLDETLTNVWIRTNNKSKVENCHTYFYGKTAVTVVEQLPERLLQEAWSIFLKYAEYPKRQLSFTDCSLIAFSKDKGMDYILSFDSEFDGILNRIY